MKKVLAFIFIMYISIVTVLAQAFPIELQNELHQYYKTNICATLIEQQKELDAALSSFDLAVLEEKRQEYYQLNLAYKEVYRKMKAARNLGLSKEEVKESFKEELLTLQNTKRTIHSSILVLIENNFSIMEKANQRLIPFREQWKIERDFIRVKYGVEPSIKFYNPLIEEVAKPNIKNKLLVFLLWNIQPKNEENSAESNLKNLAEILEISYEILAYPNPAVESINIDIDLNIEAKNVYLKFFNLGGVLLTENSIKNLAPGICTVQLNLSPYPAGIYFYLVDIDGQQKTQRIVIQK